MLAKSADTVEGELNLEEVETTMEEDLVARDVSSPKGKGVQRPVQPETVLEPSSTKPIKDVQTLDISPKAPSSDLLPHTESSGESSSSVQVQDISPTTPISNINPQTEQHGESS